MREPRGLGLRPRSPRSSCYALAARASPTRLAMRALASCPTGSRLGLGFALMACAMCLWLGLCPHISRYALTTQASTSQLALCTRCWGFTLAARAKRSWLGLRPCVSRYTLAARLGLCPCGPRYVKAAQVSPSQLALRARGSGFALAACAKRSRIGLRPCGSRYALAAR
jgi:hypothetical protein